MRKNENKSFYHYKAIFYDENGEPNSYKYYLTINKITEEFNCSRASVMNKLKEPDRIIRRGKFNNLKFYRVNEPAFIQVANPNIV